MSNHWLMRSLILIVASGIIWPILEWKVSWPVLAQVPNENHLQKIALLQKADRVNRRVLFLYHEGKYEEALPLAEFVLNIRKQFINQSNYKVRAAENNLAALNYAIGNYEEANALYREISRVISSIQEDNGITALLFDERYNEIVESSQIALSFLEIEFPKNRYDLYRISRDLAITYHVIGDYSKAKSFYLEASSIVSRPMVNHQGQDFYIDNFDVLSGLARLHVDMGDYVEAEKFYKVLLNNSDISKVHENDLIGNLSEIGSFYLNVGQLDKAISIFEDTNKICEQDSNLWLVANCLNNLGLAYQLAGKLSEAELAYQKSLPLLKEDLDTWQPLGFSGLSMLQVFPPIEVNVYGISPFYSYRSLSLYELRERDRYSRYAFTLNNIAHLYLLEKKYPEAEEAFSASLTALSQSAVELNSGSSVNFHPFRPALTDSIAQLNWRLGRYETAEALYKESLEIRKNLIPKSHLDNAISFYNLGFFYWSQGETEQALRFLREAVKIEESNLTLNLDVGTEQQKYAYLRSMRKGTSALISFHMQSGLGERFSARAVLESLLYLKGRVLSSSMNSFLQLRQRLSNEDQILLDKFSSLRQSLAALHYTSFSATWNYKSFQNELSRLMEELKEIEIEISYRSAEFRIQSQKISIESVQSLIPADASLVEIIRYSPFTSNKFDNPWSVPRYAVYTLSSDGSISAIDLGEAAPIDTLVTDFRLALGTRSFQAKAIARQLDELVMAPIRPLLGDNTHILLSPDSQLNLIPFAALFTEDDRYLIEDYQITYLNSGRDLLRLQLDKPSQQGPVILANPDYANPGSSEVVQFIRGREGVEEQGSQRSVDLTDLRFGPLPGTAEEAEAIAPLLNDGTVLTDTEATENALKQVNAPSILHIATHGFFLEDVERFVPPDVDGRGFRNIYPVPIDNNDRPIQATPRNTENPLLRSGLALAGFNQRSSGSEDGVLTALEASGLNLYGTKLVVLSACDTGVGEASTGEGVYGLRRAFVTAGAESQLMSLWQVSDYGTSELMQLYYQNLKNGQGRSEALRSAQLTLLNTDQYQHPYFWASFIFSGDWSPLEDM